MNYSKMTHKVFEYLEKFILATQKEKLNRIKKVNRLFHKERCYNYIDIDKL